MIVVDSSAVFAILFEEDDAALYASHLLQQRHRLIGAPTLLECHFVVFARYNAEGVNLLNGFVSKASLSVVEFGQNDLAAAFDARIRYGKGTGHKAQLNFGDCFSYALAKTRKLPLLFKGDDFIHTDIASAMA